MIPSPKPLDLETNEQFETLELSPTPSVVSGEVVQSNHEEVDESLYLVGRPTLKQFLRFVKSHGVNPPNEGILTDEWQAAYNRVQNLEREEAGIADNPVITKLDSSYEPLLIEFLKDPIVHNSFNTVPTEVALVELDRMIVYQKHIDLTFVRQLEEKLGPAPSKEQIFRTCLPFDHPAPPVKWSRVHRNSYVFMSPSNDLRFLGAMPVKPEQLKDYGSSGNLVGIVGAAIGFGSNFVNAIYAENRLILNNGSHRTYALRELGVTHVPCIIQHTSLRDQLDVVAASEVADHPDYFLKNPRPSMMKDYFNPQLRKVMPIHRRLRQITVKFEINEANVPAF